MRFLVECALTSRNNFRITVTRQDTQLPGTVPDMLAALVKQIATLSAATDRGLIIGVAVKTLATLAVFAPQTRNVNHR